MELQVHTLTPTQRSALEKRAAFYRKIEEKAAELGAKNPPPVRKAPPLVPLISEPAPAEAIVPAVPPDVPVQPCIETPKHAEIEVEDIQHTVARFYNKSRADLRSRFKQTDVVRPRQVAMYLAKTLTNQGLSEIGRRFGGKDHATVFHAFRKISWIMGDRSSRLPKSLARCNLQEDPVLKEEILQLRARLLTA